MRIKFRTSLLALPLAVVSCSDLHRTDPAPAAGTLRVVIGSGPKIDIVDQSRTRTQLGDDTKVEWAANDRIALWAVDNESRTVIDNEAFALWHYNAEYNTARFTGTVPAMAEGTYTYYAASPVPAACDLMRASYLIPAVQDGAFDGSCDIMVARPVQGGALVEGDNSETVNLDFRHLTHLLKIRIPSNDLGEPITEMTLTFAQPVAGRLTVDVTDPDAAPELTEGSSTLTLRFAEPKDVGDTVYATIVPAAFTPDQTVSITAAGATRQSSLRQFSGKDFAPGHMTPIAFNIPKTGPTTLRFILSDTGENTLGEKIDRFTLTAPEGCDLGGGSNVRSFEVDAAGNYDAVFEDLPAALEGAAISVGYESENALLANRHTFTVPALKAGATNTLATLSVPYLLFEDFSGIADYDNGSEWKGSDPNNTAPSTLDVCGLKGWTGSRLGVAAGTSLRISCNTIIVFGNPQSRRQGRVDTAPLADIKPGRTPAVKVSYTYCGTLFEGVGSGGNILVSAGYTRQTGGIDSKNEISDIVVPEASIDKDANNNDSHYDMADKHEKSYTIPQADAQVRLSWRVTTDRRGGIGGNGCYWLYIDNIQVSIVPANP